MPGKNQLDPRNLWRTITDPSTGQVTITNPDDDPWDTEVLLQLPHGPKPVDPGSALLEIYFAMVIGERSKTRDFSDPGCPRPVQTRRPDRHNLRPGLGRGRSAGRGG